MTPTATHATATLLQAVYKNARMGEDAMLQLMRRVKEDALKREMTVQLSRYEAFASRAAELLGEEGKVPEEEGTVTKLSSKWGMAMNAMIDSSASHLAKMIIEGATMGVNDLLGQIRDKENSNASEASLRLAREVCAFEEESIERMKQFL